MPLLQDNSRTSTPTDTSTPTPNLAREDKLRWKTYSNDEFGFSFQYPPEFNTECCGIAGPPTNDEDLITIADVPADIKGTDAPFDGLAVYIRNTHGLPFEKFIESENQLLTSFYQYSEFGSRLPVKVSQFFHSGQPGFVLENHDVFGIKRYYLRLPNRNAAILISRSGAKYSHKTFEETFNRILSTFKFLGQNPADTSTWKTYDALKDGFVENEKGNFTFKYPPEFELDHASGPARDFGSFAADFIGEDIDLNLNTVNLIGSPHNQAEAFVQGILNKEPNSMNCDLLPSCNPNTFTIRDITLPNNISATVVSGPDFDNKVFDLYFIQPELSFWFSYEDRDKWEQTRDHILSTFKFLEK